MNHAKHERPGVGRRAAWLWLACAMAAAAGQIVYDGASNAIVLTDFPVEAPATVQDVVRADQAGGWGKIAPLDGGVWRLDASLWIGDASGASTCFLLGGTGGETLELNGDLWVRPAGERALNRFQAGRPDAPDRRSVLRIRCQEPEAFGVCLGAAGCLTRRNAVELLLYHTDLEAADQPLRGGHSPRGGPASWVASRIVLDGCRVAGIGSRALYGADARNATVRDTIVEDCDRVISLNSPVLERCVLRRNRIALDRPAGCTLIDCRLEENERDIVWPDRGTIVWIDTGAGRAGPPPGLSETAPPTAAGLPEGSRAVLAEYRLAVFEARDGEGRPAAGARMDLAPQPPDARAVEAFPPILTGPDGRTSADLFTDAVLLVRARWYRPDRAEGRPLVRVPYAYDVRIALPEGAVQTARLQDEVLRRPGPWQVPEALR